MNAAKLPNEFNKFSEEDYSDTNQYILLEPYESQKYSIKINKTETGILIEANQVQNSNIVYSIELSLNDFYQLSKGFKMFDTLEEICDALQNIFIAKKVSIIKKSYSLSIILTINLIGGKEQEINIELNSHITNIENNDIKIQNLKIKELENEIILLKNDKNILLKRINNLEDLVKTQKNEFEKYKILVDEKINNIENTVNEQRYKIGKINNIEKASNEQKKEIENIKQWKNEYNLELREMLTIKKNKVTLNKIDSKIINTIEELQFLENRLKNNEILKKKNIIFKLLYRATQDGNNVQTFHNKCDNILGTLTIVQTTKGMRFGGYTEQNWYKSDKSNRIQRKDSKGVCFCFSLDLFKIYNFNDNKNYSIRCFYNYGPYFGATFFRIQSNNGLLYGYTDYTTSFEFFGKIDNDYEFNNGQQEFSVIEMEVFQIIFDN